MSKVLCIGELLWDMIPSGKLVGGAPFNVAYHLNKLGVSVKMCTKIGDDDDGKGLLDFVRKNEMDISLIQKDKKYATSLVNVIYDDKEGICYDIVAPTAWDFLEPIEYDLLDTDYVVYGSLIFRNEVSRQYVFNYLNTTKATKVFDVNLRDPHYTQETIFEILECTDVLKINEEELAILTNWLGKGGDLFESTRVLLETFNLKEVICTLGAKGAYYSTSDSDSSFFVNALKIDVVDTIGSGDSFLAGFLGSRVQGKTVKESLQFAVMLAGFVSTNKGACPIYTKDDLQKFIFNHQVI